MIMNKKITYFILIFGLASKLSYGQTAEKPTEVMPPVVGGDTDKHGCKPSAGYTFSILKNDCVRLFEQKIRLNEVEPKQSYSTFATVILSDDKRKAEIFIPMTESSVVLTRKGRKSSWKGSGFELSNARKYILKKAQKVIYQGV